MCYLFWLNIMLLKKDKAGLPKREKISPLRRQYIHQSKLSTTKAEKANTQPVPKQAKILPYTEKSCHALFDCFIKTYLHFSLHFSNFSPVDNTLSFNQQNALHSLQQKNTVDCGLWS